MSNIIFVVTNEQGDILNGFFYDRITNKEVPVNGQIQVQSNTGLLNKGGVDVVKGKDANVIVRSLGGTESKIKQAPAPSKSKPVHVSETWNALSLRDRYLLIGYVLRESKLQLKPLILVKSRNAPGFNEEYYNLDVKWEMLHELVQQETEKYYDDWLANSKAQKKRKIPTETPEDKNSFMIPRYGTSTTFTRGELVKAFMGNDMPMHKGVIEGISHAKRRVKVGGVWFDFPMIYKIDYQEKTPFKIGNIVEYQGSEWKVTFVNQTTFKGTLHLVRGEYPNIQSVNQVHPQDVKLLAHEQPTRLTPGFKEQPQIIQNPIDHTPITPATKADMKRRVEKFQKHLESKQKRIDFLNEPRLENTPKRSREGDHRLNEIMSIENENEIYHYLINVVSQGMALNTWDIEFERKRLREILGHVDYYLEHKRDPALLLFTPADRYEAGKRESSWFDKLNPQREEYHAPLDDRIKDYQSILNASEHLEIINGIQKLQFIDPSIPLEKRLESFRTIFNILYPAFKAWQDNIYAGKAGENKEIQLKRKMLEIQRHEYIDYFPTPPDIADRMVQQAILKPGVAILEPSAGTGAIADAIRRAGFEPDVIEVVPDFQDVLKLKGYNLVGSDFMDFQGKYDRILMNPPFGKYPEVLDVQHVQKAFNDNLNINGILVAIMSEGPFFRDNARDIRFREWFDEMGGASYKLDPDTFKESGTGAQTRIVRIKK